MKTLVTGATGLLGNNLVRLLLQRGDAVRVLTRGSSDARALAGLDVERVVGDVTDPDAVTRAVNGTESVLHSAGKVQIGWTGMEESYQVNVVGTRNVATAALRAGVPLVHVSSIDALGPGRPEQPGHEDTPPDEGRHCPYVVNKRKAEQEILQLVAQGLQAKIVNPGFMIGPWDWKPSSGRMLLEVAKGWAFFAPPGGNVFCDVRCVAEGVLVAAEKGKVGRRYVLGGENLSYFDAWTLFAQVTGVRRPRVLARRRHLAVAGFVGDCWARLTGREGDVNSASTRLSSQPRNFTSRRAIEELGYRTGELRDAATAAWRWFKENGYA